MKKTEMIAGWVERNLLGPSIRARRSNKYIPAGPNANVRGTYVKNPRVAAHENMMHEKWIEKKGFKNA